MDHLCVDRGRTDRRLLLHPKETLVTTVANLVHNIRKFTRILRIYRAPGIRVQRTFGFHSFFARRANYYSSGPRAHSYLAWPISFCRTGIKKGERINESLKMKSKIGCIRAISLSLSPTTSPAHAAG